MRLHRQLSGSGDGYSVRRGISRFTGGGTGRPSTRVRGCDSSNVGEPDGWVGAGGIGGTPDGGVIGESGGVAGTGGTGGALLLGGGTGAAGAGTGVGATAGGVAVVGGRGALRMASFSSGVARRIWSVIRCASSGVPTTRGVIRRISSLFSSWRSLKPNR